MSEKSHLKNVFISGFGGYQNLFPSVSKCSEFFVPFIDSDEAIQKAIDRGGSTLMGWSTGAHIIAKAILNLKNNWDKIVLVAPFDDFTKSFGVRVIDAMIKGLDKNFHQTMGLFYKKCGIRGEFVANPSDKNSLKEGLEFLKYSKVNEGSSLENITIIHGCNDEIAKRTAVLKLLKLFDNSKFMEVDQPHFISENILMRFF